MDDGRKTALMVVDQGEITQTIDLNAFVRRPRRLQTLTLNAKEPCSSFEPKAKITSVNEEQLISPEGIALLVLISLIIIGIVRCGRVRPNNCVGQHDQANSNH